MGRKTYTLFSVLFFFLLLTSVFAQDNKNNLTAEQIIEKHFVAVGGKEKLSAIKSRVAIGFIKVANQGKPIQFVLFTESPNRLTAYYLLEKYNWSLTYDGKKFFSRPIELLSKNVVLIGKSSRLEDKFNEMYSSGLMFSQISLYNILLNPNPEITIKTNKTKKVNDHPAYIIEIKSKKFGLMRAYFNTETFMWVRTDYGNVELSDTRLALDNSGGGISTVDFYIEASDFREVDGIKLPYKIKHTMVPPVSPNNRSSMVEVEMKEYKQNVLIDPKMFQ
jgi:hypothetical protein